MPPSKILVVDDDTTVLDKVRKLLGREGYAVETASEGHTALKKVTQFEPDLVVLDITFPGVSHNTSEPLDGIEVLRRVSEGQEIPVLMLSSTAVSAMKVMALSLGADDYLTKPFDSMELLARVKAILRRTQGRNAQDKILDFGVLRMDPGARRVWKGDKEVELTAIEFELLHSLARRPGQVFTRDRLIESAWKYSYYGVPKVVDVHIGHIRRKIEDDPKAPKLIVTVRGTGYRFEGQIG